MLGKIDSLQLCGDYALQIITGVTICHSIYKIQIFALLLKTCIYTPVCAGVNTKI